MDAHFNQIYSTEMLPHLNTKIELIKHMGISAQITQFDRLKNQAAYNSSIC